METNWKLKHWGLDQPRLWNFNGMETCRASHGSKENWRFEERDDRKHVLLQSDLLTREYGEDEEKTTWTREQKGERGREKREEVIWISGLWRDQEWVAWSSQLLLSFFSHPLFSLFFSFIVEQRFSAFFVPTIAPIDNNSGIQTEALHVNLTNIW